MITTLWVAAGCSVVTEEPGIQVRVVVEGVGQPEGLTEAWAGVRAVSLSPCAVAWHPLDLLGAPARADHSIDSPASAAFPGVTDLLGDGRQVTLTPPVETYCFARLVLEPSEGDGERDGASVGAVLPDGAVRSDQVAWLDLPLDPALALSADAPRATLTLGFVLDGWVAAAGDGAPALFDHARNHVVFDMRTP